MDKQTVLSILKLLLSAILVCKPESAKPNIVLIVADDLGWNDVGFHGSRQVSTPNLDSLANDGIILNNYYTLALCSPSRTALMTGRHPIRVGLQYYVIDVGQRLGVPLSYRLLPEYLNDLGYESHIVGKWHLGWFQRNYTPTYRGFRTFYGYYTGRTDYFDHRLQDGPPDVYPKWWGLDWHFNEGSNLRDVNEDFSEYSSKLFANRANEIISKHAFEKNPLFLYLALQNVHSANVVDPIQAPGELDYQFQNIWHNLRRRYVGNVYEMDLAVGNVLRSLELRGVLDNTVIVFTSDNGGAPNGFNYNWGNNFPLRAGKGYYFEGGTRAVAFVWGDLFKSRAGDVSKDLMFIGDWFPTLYEAAGGKIEDLGDIDSFSMLDLFTEKNRTSPRSEVLLNIDPVFDTKAIRVHKYKYILNPFDMYDSSYDYWFQAPGSLPYSNETIRANSTKSQVWCGDILSGVDFRCHSNKTGLNECVFDIENDPCEYENLVDIPEFSEVKQTLLDRIAYWETLQVKPMIPPYEDEANPKYHNWVWGPWTEDPAIPPNSI